MNNQPTAPLLEDLGEMLGYVQLYVDKNIQATKLTLLEHIAKGTASIFSILLLLCLLPVILCLFSIGLGYWLVETWQWSYSQVFLALAGGYSLLLAIIFMLRRPLLTNPIITRVVRAMFQAK